MNRETSSKLVKYVPSLIYNRAATCHRQPVRYQSNRASEKNGSNGNNSSNNNSSNNSDETIRLSRERSSVVFKNFFSIPSINDYSKKQSVRLTPTIMLYSGRNVDTNYLIKSAQYVQREMPIRISHRIYDLRNLPFIVASSPALLAVHDLYVWAFEKLSNFKPIETPADDRAYCLLLRQLLHEHRNVVTYLAEGFEETGHFFQDKAMIQQFLDSMLTGRLGTRMLAEHHISLHEERPNHVGIINLKFSPKILIQSKVEEAKDLCEHEYGVAPPVKLIGNLDAIFPYISQPLDYILFELLKNSFRAVVETHFKGSPDKSHFVDDEDGALSSTLPPIRITIVSNDVDFMIRISDRGGGIPYACEDRIWEYLFTTGGRSTRNSKDPEFGIGMMVAAAANMISGPIGGLMHGFGFGLPASRAYTKFLGGSLNLQSMPGYGTDVYIRLRHIDGRLESFRI